MLRLRRRFYYMNWGDKMDFVYIGKIVSTHGIKGEIKILSDFEYKDHVFKVGNVLWISDKAYTIRSYRHHKNYEMVTLDDYHDINDVLFLMKKKVYVKKSDLNLLNTEILDEDLEKFQVLTKEGKRGIIKEIFWASPKNKILRVMFDREVLIPYFSPMVVSVDKEKQEIFVELPKGM